MYSSWYDDWERVAEEVAGLELSFPVFHVEKRVGTAISRNEAGDREEAARLFEINCGFAERIGSKKLVFHLWDGEPSDRDIRNNIQQYISLNQTAKQHGLLLTIENVVCNRENPLKHLSELHEADSEAAFAPAAGRYLPAGAAAHKTCPFSHPLSLPRLRPSRSISMEPSSFTEVDSSVTLP